VPSHFNLFRGEKIVNKLIAAVGVFVCATAASVSNAQPVVTMSVIQHNIHSGGQGQTAANHIADLLEMTPQKALVLCEEANYARQYFTLPYSGWQHIWPSSPFEGKGNPTFTRTAAATVLSSWVMNMTKPWTYNGNNREPRVFTVVKCQLVANPWVQFHCINVHFPPYNSDNVAARTECIDKVIEFSTSNPDLPLIVCGDYNLDVTEVTTRIANPIGGRVFSNANVDHMIVRDGTQVGFNTAATVTRLGLMTSDHQALRYDISFKVLEKIIDNSNAGFTASTNWSTGTSAADKYGSDYRFRSVANVSDTAKWSFSVPVTSNYEIFAWWSQGANRSSTAPYLMPNGTTVYKNQQTGGGAWQSLGTFSLAAGTRDVQLSCWTSNGSVVVGDAMKLVPR
jgi:endonuclease/exonuclease/phosphatase family metal-dependent hydrolase